MKKISYLIFLILLVVGPPSLKGQNPNEPKIISVEGTVLSLAGFEAIPYTHCYTQRGRITTTDLQGDFKIKVHLKDTIFFSNQQYKNDFYIVLDSLEEPIKIVLEEGEEFLEEVEVRDEIYTIIQDPDTMRYKLLYKDNGPMQLTTASPVTGLWMLFLNERQEMKELIRLMEQNKEFDLIKEEANKRLSDALNLVNFPLIDGHEQSIINYCGVSNYSLANCNSDYCVLKIIGDCPFDYLTHLNNSE